MQEKIESLLNEVLAYLFGEQAHVILAKAKQDPNGYWYVDVVWMRPGALTPCEGRICERSVSADAQKIPRGAFASIAREIASQDMSKDFRLKLAAEALA